MYTNNTTKRIPSRRSSLFLGVALTFLVMGCLFASPSRAGAQDTVYPGRMEPFPDAMLAYRLGNYYLVKGDLDRAIEYLTAAIDLVPEWAFSADTGYADLYWTLGEALEGSGRYAEALTNYRRFLALVGDEAAPWTTEKVEVLMAQYGSQAALSRF